MCVCVYAKNHKKKKKKYGYKRYIAECIFCKKKTEGKIEKYFLIPSSPAAEKWGKLTPPKGRKGLERISELILGERPIAVSQAVTLVRPPHTKR